MQSIQHCSNTGNVSAAGNVYAYQYRTVSVKHFAELQEDIDRLRRNGQLSDSPVFQEHIQNLKFATPEDFPDAQSVIIMALSIPPMRVNFQWEDGPVTAIMPSGYYESGLTEAILLDEVQTAVIPETGHRVEHINDLHFKLLAVRSGLGRYGRNNICYVEGMGSFLTLHAFLTDYCFEADHWGEMQRMDLCQECRICLNQCPGGAIREDHFVIDAKRCITLYNENPGEFPAWIPADAHNALVGCMKCQASCPANREAMQHIGQFEDITAAEVRQFVGESPDPEVILSLSKKLRISYLVNAPEMVKVFARNIQALLP